MTETEYKYIRAWGKLLGSMDYYIKGQIEQARQDKAPPTAIYRRHNGSWQIWENIADPITKDNVKALAEG